MILVRGKAAKPPAQAVVNCLFVGSSCNLRSHLKNLNLSGLFLDLYNTVLTFRALVIGEERQCCDQYAPATRKRDFQVVIVHI